MLGLGPRLRARNSLWDLVNKNKSHRSYPSSEPLPTPSGALDGLVDDLPPLPSTPSPPSPTYIPESHPSSSTSSSPTMAPVRSLSIANRYQSHSNSTFQSSRKTSDLGRRLARINMVGRHIQIWSWKLRLSSPSRLLRCVANNASQDPSTRYRGMCRYGRSGLNRTDIG